MDKYRESVELELFRGQESLEPDITCINGESLVLGEIRSSVVTGGSVAKASLLEKPKVLIRSIECGEAVVHNASEFEQLPSGDISLTRFLSEAGVDRIESYIGVLFDTERKTRNYGLRQTERHNFKRVQKAT